MNIKKMGFLVLLVLIIGAFVYADNSRLAPGYYIYTGTRTDIDFMIYIGDFYNGWAPFSFHRRSDGRLNGAENTCKIVGNMVEVFDSRDKGSAATRGKYNARISGRNEIQYNGHTFRHQNG